MSDQDNLNQPIVVRARLRRTELESILYSMPPEETQARRNIELALATANSLLTGDLNNLSDTVKADLSKWLEENKNLGANA